MRFTPCAALVPLLLTMAADPAFGQDAAPANLTPFVEPEIDRSLAFVIGAASRGDTGDPAEIFAELRILQATGLALGARWVPRRVVPMMRVALAVADVDYVQLVPFIEREGWRGAGTRAGATMALPLFAPFLPVRLHGALATIALASPVRPLRRPALTFGLEWFLP